MVYAMNSELSLLLNEELSEDLADKLWYWLSMDWIWGGIKLSGGLIKRLLSKYYMISFFSRESVEYLMPS